MVHGHVEVNISFGYRSSLCLNFYRLLARKSNLEFVSIYSNKFSLVRIQFYLSQASGKWVSTKTAGGLVAATCIWRGTWSCAGEPFFYPIHHLFNRISVNIFWHTWLMRFCNSYLQWNMVMRSTLFIIFYFSCGNQNNHPYKCRSTPVLSVIYMIIVLKLVLLINI